ncbi:hypothetical protein ES708_31262 [subsurface metagenome]
MEAGAYGMSTGLDFEPQEYAPTSEIVELAKIVTQYHGIYATHHYHIQDQWATTDKDELGYGVFHGPIEDMWYGIYRGLLQAIEIGRKAKIPVQISHLGNVYKILQPHPEYLDRACAQATLKIIDEAREEGIDITFDTFSDNKSICGPRQIIVEFLYSRIEKMNWLNKYSKAEFVEQLKTEKFREKIRDLDRHHRLKFSMIHTGVNPYWSHYFQIIFSNNPAYLDRTIAEIALEKQSNPLDAVFDLIIEDPEIIWTQSVDPRLMGPIAEEFLQHPYEMPITDMMSLPDISISLEEILKLVNKSNSDEILNMDQLKIGLNSPNYYGIFPNLIRQYVVSKKIFTIEQAIYKLTKLPAWRLGIKDRGVIKQGKAADLVIFNLDEIRSRSSMRNPRQQPVGIKYVIVNGIIVSENGVHTGQKPGEILKKNKN